jgi:hypothetical protein
MASGSGMVGEVEWMRNQIERILDTRIWHGGRAGWFKIVPIGDPRLSPAWIECTVPSSPIEQPTDLAYLFTPLLSVSRSTTKTSQTEVSAVLNSNKEGTTLLPADNLVMVDSRDMVDNRGTAGTLSNRGTERLLLSSTEGVDMGDLLRGILSSNSPYVMFYVSSGA